MINFYFPCFRVINLACPCPYLSRWRPLFHRCESCRRCPESCLTNPIRLSFSVRPIPMPFSLFHQSVSDWPKNPPWQAGLSYSSFLTAATSLLNRMYVSVACVILYHWFAKSFNLLLKSAHAFASLVSGTLSICTVLAGSNGNPSPLSFQCIYVSAVPTWETEML